MRTAAVAFLLSLVTAAFLTPLARRLAHRIGAIDHALSSRKVHEQPIPRMGGIAIVGAFYAPLIALLFTDTGVGRLFFADEREAIGLFVGGAVIAALGIYDDLKGADARKKFIVQFAVAGFVYWAGFRIDELSNPFGDSIDLGWLGLPFTMLWIAGIVNAINLIDGLDGLAGGVAFVSVLTTFVAAMMHNEPLMALMTAALGGAILGFLWYNFNPASVFMGDTGSMFLGFVLATSAIESHHKSEAAVAIIVPIIALGLPITDTLLAMARRALRGTPLFLADREHIHHRLLRSGSRTGGGSSSCTARPSRSGWRSPSPRLPASRRPSCSSPSRSARGSCCATSDTCGSSAGRCSRCSRPSTACSASGPTRASSSSAGWTGGSRSSGTRRSRSSCSASTSSTP
jgi:UDP-GlcNAc:undecaprenyl-phosphate GlcNAc-1-phosphate transferase